MKRLVLCLFAIFFFTCVVNSQNVVSLMRSFGGSNVKVCRNILVPSEMAQNAVEVSMLQRADRCVVERIGCNLNFAIRKDIVLNSVKSPITLYGPYNYLRAFTKVSKDDKFVNKKFLNDWKHIRKIQGYNGVHHLISKGTIKRIYEDLNAQGKDVSLIDMENNAPAIFHPLHGSPAYKDVFHNIDNQYYDYQRFGMKVTIISLLERIDEINISIGLKPYPEWYLNGILKESELWCKYYGIRW